MNAELHWIDMMNGTEVGFFMEAIMLNNVCSNIIDHFSIDYGFNINSETYLMFFQVVQVTIKKL